MNPALLLRVLLWDVRIQSRERIYLFTIVTTAAFVAVVMLLPDNTPITVITAILFLDPAIIGMSFVGALVLLERTQNVLPALAVTPASSADYALAKILTFVALTIVGSLTVVFAAWWPPSIVLVLRMALALTFIGALAVLGGLVMVATAYSINHFIARIVPVSLVVAMPLIGHFGIVGGSLAWVLFGWSPGHAMLRALLWAAEPSAITPAELVYAFAYMAVLNAILFRWAIVLLTRTIGDMGS